MEEPRYLTRGGGRAWRRWPPERVRRVGVLITGVVKVSPPRRRQGRCAKDSRNLGWMERRNLPIELAFESDPETIRARAEVLVASTPDRFPYRLEAG
jgi:hypothetical protein